MEQGLEGFQKSLHAFALDESCLNTGRVNARDRYVKGICSILVLKVNLPMDRLGHIKR